MVRLQMNRLRLYGNKLTLTFFIIFLLFSAFRAWIKLGSVPDFPWGCDLFGHLQIAKEIRTAWKETRWPDFRFTSPQGRELIHWFKLTGTPSARWNEVVAPHAHHYVERSNSIINQYPPGSGLLFSFFKEGYAVSSVTRVEILTFLVLGLSLLFITWRRQKLIPSSNFLTTMGLVTLSAYLGIDVLEKYRIGNYSLQAILLPLLLTVIFGLAARTTFFWPSFSETCRARCGNGFVALAGIFMGISGLIRIPCFLHLLGWFYFIPRKLWISFGLGVFLFGIFPLAIYQHQTVGAWWASTYNSGDTALPNWKAIGPYLRYYLVKGEGAQFFILPLLVSIGAWAIKRQQVKPPSTTELKNLPLALNHAILWKTVALIWGVSTVFFITHVPAVLYYLVPAHLTAAWLIMGSVWLEEYFPRYNKMDLQHPSQERSSARPFVQAISLIPLGIIFYIGIFQFIKEPKPTPLSVGFEAQAFNIKAIPQELLFPNAWIWSDSANGAFWYTARKAAFKLSYGASPVLRAQLFKDLDRRGQPQYLVMDGNGSNDLAREYEVLGATFEHRGRVFGKPYIRVKMPPH